MTTPTKPQRSAAYDAAVRAAIDAAPPVGPAESARLSRAWRASGSELIFDADAPAKAA